MSKSYGPDDGMEVSAPLAAGTIVSHYRIIRRIGSGGMGEVYLAQDAKLDRRVALKFLPERLCRQEDFRAGFKAEAQAAAKIDHPNVVSVYEVDEYRARPFIVLQYVEGRSLRRYVADRRCTIGEALELAVQLCEGLSAAHEQGIVHRDIKPENILIDSTGRLKIADFGLSYIAARGAEGGEGFAGTAQYVAPELLRGGAPGRGADLYSAGVVIYELLTGRPPFTGEYDAAITYAVLNENPQPVTVERPDAPAELVRIIERLLEKDPAKRYAAARDVIRDIRPLMGMTEDTGRLPGRKWWRTAALAAAAAVVTVGVVVLVVRLMPGDRSGLRPVRTKVAVLPFENLGAGERDYFVDGMTDAVTMRLAQVQRLGVISRTSAMRYRDSEMSSQEIGQELGVEYVVSGSVQWETVAGADRVRVNAWLIRVDDAVILWSKWYDRVLTGIFSVQADIAANVSGALDMAMSDAERVLLEAHLTADLEAYDFYLKGNDYFYRSWSPEHIRTAIRLYEQAVAVDSNFAVAHAMLARCHASMYWEHYDRSEDRRQQAYRAARRAMELQPDLAEAHLALGYWYYHCARDYKKALQEFSRGLKIQPGNAQLYNAIAVVQRREGRLAESVQNFTRALELDPRSHLKAFDVALTHGLMRHYGEAHSYLNRTIGLSPDWSIPYVFQAWLHILQTGDVPRAQSVLDQAALATGLFKSQYYWWLARMVEPNYDSVLSQTRPGADTAAYMLHRAQLYRLMERREEERACADTALRILKHKEQTETLSPRQLSDLGLAYAGLRDEKAALAYASQAAELLPTSRDAFDALFLLVNLAEVQVIFGRYDDAIVQLTYLLSIPGFVTVPYLKRDPLWKPLHNHPGFARLVAQAT